MSCFCTWRCLKLQQYWMKINDVAQIKFICGKNSNSSSESVWCYSQRWCHDSWWHQWLYVWLQYITNLPVNHWCFCRTWHVSVHLSNIHSTIVGLGHSWASWYDLQIHSWLCCSTVRGRNELFSCLCHSSACWHLTDFLLLSVFLFACVKVLKQKFTLLFPHKATEAFMVQYFVLITNTQMF